MNKQVFISINKEIIFNEGLCMLFQQSGYSYFYTSTSMENALSILTHELINQFNFHEDKFIFLIPQDQIDSECVCLVEQIKNQLDFCKFIILTASQIIEKEQWKIEFADFVFSKKNHFKTLVRMIQCIIEPEFNEIQLNEKVIDKNSTNNRLSLLSNRELEVLNKIVEGFTNKQIADSLHITERTVKNHITNILKKLKLKDRTQAAIFYMKSI